MLPQEIRLAGEAIAELTVAEHNAWVTYCQSNEAYRRLFMCDMRLRRAIAAKRTTDEVLDNYSDDLLAAKREMHAVAQAWVVENTISGRAHELSHRAQRALQYHIINEDSESLQRLVADLESVVRNDEVRRYGEDASP